MICLVQHHFYFSIYHKKQIFCIDSWWGYLNFSAGWFRYSYASSKHLNNSSSRLLTNLKKDHHSAKYNLENYTKQVQEAFQTISKCSMFEKYSRSDIKHENKIRNFFGNALSTSSFKYIKFLSVTDNSCLASKFCLISFSYPIISTFSLKTVQNYQQDCSRL